jgi:signal peptidase I
VTRLALLLAAALLARRRLLLVTVTGSSMAPTYAEGDRLLVRRARRARRGSVVVLRGPGGLRVKRVAAAAGDPVPAGMPVPDAVVPPGRLLVLGDNPDRSADSRTGGYLAAADLVGVAVRGRVPLARGGDLPAQ